MSGNGRIRVLHSVGPAQMAGTQRALLTYLEAANRERFEHHVICHSPGPLVQRLRRAGIPVSLIQGRARWHPAAALRFGALLRRGRFDLFHLNPSRVEALIARALGVPVVCRRNVGFEPFWAQWRQRGPIARLLNRVIDRFIVPAAFLVGEYERRGVPRERVRVVHNGVAVSSPPPAAVAQARREMTDRAAPLVVCAGRLVALKGHHVLLHAAARLQSAGANFSIALIGEGERGGALEQLARDLGLAARTRFLGWKDDAAPYLAGADLFVQPSLSDVLPNAVLEAMALGRCVVASDVGGMREAIEPGVSGALVPAGDAEALAAQLGALLGDARTRERLGIAARARVARDFTVGEMARRTEAVYEELLEAKR